MDVVRCFEIGPDAGRVLVVAHDCIEVEDAVEQLAGPEPLVDLSARDIRIDEVVGEPIVRRDRRRENLEVPATRYARSWIPR